MSKDNKISIDEFCLFVEGVKVDFEQRMQQFSPEFEARLKTEVE